MAIPITSGSYNYKRETSTSASVTHGTPGTPADQQERGRSVTLYEDSFHAGGTYASHSGSFGGPGSVITGNGNVDFGEASISGDVEVSADLTQAELNADVSAQGSAYLVDAQGTASVDLGAVDATVDANAQVGVSGAGNATLNIDPLDGDVAASVDLEAFAGVRAGADVTASVGPLEATAGAEVLAGVGAELEADVGFQDGEFSAKVDVGASLGIGFSLEFEVNVDVGGIAEDVGSALGNAADAVGDFFKRW